MVPYKGSTRPQIGQKWAKMCQNWGFSEYFGNQSQLNSSLWIIYVKTHNFIILFKQIKQNNPNCVPYKGSTRPQIGQKWAKMSKNVSKLRFFEYFGHQTQLNCSL